MLTFATTRSPSAPASRRGTATVLVTDGEQRSSLAVVRSLGRAGYTVVVVSALRHPLAAASRHCGAAYTVPDPSGDADGYVEGVARIADQVQPDVVIPMTDTSTPLVLRLREGRPDLRIPFPDLATYETVSDKSRLVAMAPELGVPAPRQVVVPSPAGARGGALDDALAGQLSFPLIVKPARSAVQTEKGVRRFGVRSVFGRDALVAALGAYPGEAYPVLLQERIEGPGLGAFVLGDGQGRLVASFAHRRIREKPPSGGVSVYRESVPLRDDMRECAERLMARVRWRGVLMLEFKEDAATGVPYLMEANGRFWGSLQLAIDAGVDFPRMLVESALGEEVVPVHEYRSGVRSRWLWGDFDHLLAILRAPRGYRSQHPFLPGRMRALARFLVPWRPGDRYEVLRPTDPMPFLRESRQWFTSLGGG